MSQAVTADAQFGTARVLKPMDNFEALYQGLPAVTSDPPVLPNIAVPVPFFEWPNGRPPKATDPLAGQDGYDPRLLNFIAVPKGAIVRLWIPQIVRVVENLVLLPPYRYCPVWRNTSLAVYVDREGDGQYHLPDQAPGAPNGLLVPPARRFILPAATSTLAYNQPEISPTGPQAGEVNLRRQWFVVRGGETPLNPIIAPVTPGVYQQGILDPAFVGTAVASVPIFEEVEFDAKGDQMLIVCDRPRDTLAAAPNWDFNGFDQGFSNLYGRNVAGPVHPPFPQLGIYVWTGTNP